MSEKNTQLLQPEDMPELTEQEFSFMLAVARGSSGAQAYRDAFPDKVHWAPNAIWAAASRLKASSKVQAWLTKLQEENLERGKLSMDEYIGMQLGLMRRAEKSGNYGAAANCLHKAGQASGHHNEQKAEDTDSRSEAQLLAELTRLRSELSKEGVTVH